MGNTDKASAGVIRLLRTPFCFVKRSCNGLQSVFIGIICGTMSYDEAYDEAKAKVEAFPQFEQDGRTWVTVDGHDYPKDWFVRNCALMKLRSEV